MVMITVDITPSAIASFCATSSLYGPWMMSSMMYSRTEQ